MKTIVAALDFSEVSENALRYAAGLAQFARARLILFHAYHIYVPTSSSDAPMITTITPESLEEDNMNALRSMEHKMKGMQEDIDTELVLRTGFFMDEILEFLDEREVDLVIMGVTGAGKTGGSLFGSNAALLMRKTKVPVLVVPREAKFRRPANVVLACDFNEQLSSRTTEKIRTFVELFKSNLLLIDVLRPLEPVTIDMEISEHKIERSLAGVQHSVHYNVGEDVVEGINSFVDETHAGWLIMVPQHHGFLERIFHRSNTRRMAFHTHVPLLSIHG